MEITRGGPGDVPAIMRMLDDAQDWLASQGRTGQWGTDHWSGVPASVARFTALATTGTVWLARADGDGGEVAGVVITSTTAAEYVPAADEPEHYISLLVIARAFAGRGVGAALLDHALAQARAAGVGLVRVDCYDGDDHRLVAYYEKQGFTSIGTFTARNGTWPGRLLGRRV
ncbi:GNAT family N-acetyltransferase [Lentzea sp. NPDC058436]|uniref:GNAT family N-acetyltransferase n=1 Tax=Lentzea sp. NPDC058436 TaxID=3346499 RepID=UPI00364C3746